MYEVKKQIYLSFTKNQKSSLLNYLRAYVKKCINLEVSEIFDKFIEDEKYYQELNCSKFEFLKDVMFEDWFKKIPKNIFMNAKNIMNIKNLKDRLLKQIKLTKNKKGNFLKK